jgi:CDP-diglyceride synthetase
MKVDEGIVRRGLTISTVAPAVLYALTIPWVMSGLVWALTFVGMLEWTAMKRHLKVALLFADRDGVLSRLEYPVPAAKTNLFIVVKCLACSAVTLGAVYGQDQFHLGMCLYFLFWVIFTLMAQNKAETNAAGAQKKRIGSPSAPSANSAAVFNQMELTVIAEKFTTELFLSFCLEYFGFVWVTGLSHSLLMYQIPEYGHLCVVMVLVANWANDIAALIIGRSLKGRTRALYPKISPNKSVEGAVAGVVFNGIVAAVIMSVFGSHLDFLGAPVCPLFFVVGCVFGVLGVIGDLLQSLFKRTALLKDTGTVFPGHGGVLDRVDGLLVVFPAAYWMLWIFLKFKQSYFF